MCRNCGGDVIASVSTFSRNAGATGESLAVALHARDFISRARLFVRYRVVTKLDDANERLDRACFVDGVFEFGGGGELNHVRVLRFRDVLLTCEILPHAERIVKGILPCKEKIY